MGQDPENGDTENSIFGLIFGSKDPDPPLKHKGHLSLTSRQG